MRATTEVARNLATFGRLLLQPTFTCSQSTGQTSFTTIKNLKLSTVFLLNRRSVAPLLVLRCKPSHHVKFHMFMPPDTNTLSPPWCTPHNVSTLNNTTNILPYLLESPNLTNIAITNHWLLSWLTSLPLSTLVSSISLILPTKYSVLQQKWIQTPLTTVIKKPVSLSGVKHWIRD